MELSRSGAVLRALASAFAAVVSFAPLQDLPAQSQPTLAEQIEAAVPQLRARLPIQVDPVTTWTGIRSEGTEFVYEMSVSMTIPPAQLATIHQAIQDSNQTRVCADVHSGALIRRGASMRHLYTDPAGTRFETRIVTCPPAPAG